MTRAQKAKTQLADEARIILFCTRAEKTSSHSRNAKAKVRVRNNEFLVHRGDIVEIVEAVAAAGVVLQKEWE